MAAAAKVKRQNEGGKAFDDREIAAYGWNVADAIRFTLEHLRKQIVSVPLESAVNELIEAKEGVGRSERYCKDLRLRLGRVCAAFDCKTVAQISTADLERSLCDLDVQQRPGYSWRTAHPGVFHAIGLSAGLRVAEISRSLDWRDVDLVGGFIRVGARISKTRSRRLVPILENLRTWLQPIAEPSGPVLLNPDTRCRHEGAPPACGNHGMAGQRHAPLIRFIPAGSNPECAADSS